LCADSFKLEITFYVRGVLSPLLSNLVLDELDRELERRGHRFSRYADDCNIYVGSERAGQRVMESITHFITHRLKLKVNQAKSAVARPGQRKFLGFSFTGEREPRRRIAPKAIARFKERIREQTWRTRGISLRQMVKELATYLRGWLGYRGDCQTPSVLQSLEMWLRRRLRSMVWKQWKRGRTRFRELRKRGGGGSGGTHCRQSSRPLAARELARFDHRFADCLLGSARTSAHGRAVLA
jgi:RNA-directed DNA polymerase